MKRRLSRRHRVKQLSLTLALRVWTHIELYVMVMAKTVRLVSLKMAVKADDGQVREGHHHNRGQLQRRPVQGNSAQGIKATLPVALALTASPIEKFADVEVVLQRAIRHLARHRTAEEAEVEVVTVDVDIGIAEVDVTQAVTQSVMTAIRQKEDLVKGVSLENMAALDADIPHQIIQLVRVEFIVHL